MSAQVLKISPWVPVAVYGIIPILLYITIADILFFNEWLKNSSFLVHPDVLFFFFLLFQIPHHVASFFSLADKEYLLFYKWKLIIGLPILYGVFALLLWHVPSIAFIVFLLYAGYHAMSQQVGVLRMLGTSYGFLQNIWRWSGVALLVAGFGIALSGSSLGFFLEKINFEDFYYPIAILLLGFLLVSVNLFIHARTVHGKWFVVGAVSGILAGYFFLLIGYPFFAIFSFHFIHDVTAFLFYISHDHNRNNSASQNILYHMFSWTRLPVFVLTPLIAIGIGFVIKNILLASTIVLLFIFITHYYIESFVWKRTALHRQYISIS